MWPSKGTAPHTNTYNTTPRLCGMEEGGKIKLIPSTHLFHFLCNTRGLSTEKATYTYICYSSLFNPLLSTPILLPSLSLPFTHPDVGLGSTVACAFKQLRSCIRWTATERLQQLILHVVVAKPKVYAQEVISRQEVNNITRTYCSISL